MPQAEQFGESNLKIFDRNELKFPCPVRIWETSGLLQVVEKKQKVVLPLIEDDESSCNS